MDKEEIKECFGDQAGVMLEGVLPTECIECEIFERCHKITTLVTLRSMQTDIDLITQNGLVLGWLKGYKELQEIMGDDETDDE